MFLCSVFGSCRRGNSCTSKLLHFNKYFLDKYQLSANEIFVILSVISTIAGFYPLRYCIGLTIISIEDIFGSEKQGTLVG